MQHAELTMQEALIRLTEYWASQGCLIAQPMNTEVGAGTLNPATALRVLGPEPWRVGYVEPSVRPDDSRYGDNPNRLQTHTQYQVILKPEPGDTQDLYLGSLRALGIDLDRHDIRFVEDNWASPALGAWGLGWEVWLDGLEITQFTYFQQSGGVSLDPVSVEITYGMERIVMALQRVAHFADITYAPGISYGEVFGQVEYEMSRYYLDDADVETNRRLFEAYEAEARRMLDARLPVPAHTYVLKCSHAFNVLDSRGAIGTAERTRAFARMRSLAHEVATLWIARREELGHPLGVTTTATRVTESVPPDSYPQIDAPAPLAFEIGTEELPPDEVTRSAEAVRETLADRLAATRLGHGGIRVVSSPRRIVALVDDVQPREDDSEQTVRGPRASAAHDADGIPTKAALGFARAQGVDVGELRRLSLDGGEYVGVVRQVVGRPAAEVLAAILPEVVSGLRADRNMRWNAPGSSFSRPIRWLLALLGDVVVPFSAVGTSSGRRTRVHRTAASPVVEVSSAADYLPTLRAYGIVADGGVRREMVLRQAAELATGVDGVVDATGERAVTAEITNLVEEPVAILGGFDEDYLDLPAEILTTVMRKHQRYLPVRDPSGGLMAYFVAVANGECDQEAVRAGNEAVLRARYEDAAFFWAHDLRTPPERMAQGLTRLTFTERLGSMADRASRVRAIALELAEDLDLDGAERAVLERSGRLAKFDLASQMVIELSSLAGVMAREYARLAGEPDAVAEALFEMELPRFSGDTLPATIPGALLGLADRLDLLAGLFATGAVPSGSSDPFGLRRAALGLTAILRTQPRLVAVTVDGALDVAARHQPVETGARAREEAAEFVARRFEQYLLDADHPVHVVRAVLPLAAVPARAEQAAADLEKLLGDPQFERLTTALDRSLRILPAEASAGYDPALFEDPAERRLADAADRVRSDLEARRVVALPEFVAAAGVLVEPINALFDDVLVMADDPAVRANRLGLLATVRDLAAGIIDWREIT